MSAPRVKRKKNPEVEKGKCPILESTMHTEEQLGTYTPSGLARKKSFKKIHQ